MSKFEFDRPQLNEHTVPNHGRSMDDFEPDTRTPLEAYEVNRIRKIDRINGMLERPREEVLKRAQYQMAEIFFNLRSQIAQNPNTERLQEGFYHLLDNRSIDGQKTQVTFYLSECTDGPESAGKLTVITQGLNSYLIAAETASFTKNRGSRKGDAHESSAATSVDVTFYDKMCTQDVRI